MNRFKIFSFINILLMIAAAVFLLYAIIFLIRQLNDAFNPNLIKKPEVVNFNLTEAGKLKLLNR